jgi:hypothetical protein
MFVASSFKRKTISYYEAYQIILQELVNSLIQNHNISPNVYQFVGDLWVRYLDLLAETENYALEELDLSQPDEISEEQISLQNEIAAAKRKREIEELMANSHHNLNMQGKDIREIQEQRELAETEFIINQQENTRDEDMETTEMREEIFQQEIGFKTLRYDS